jgi:putative oxidoreductase
MSYGLLLLRVVVGLTLAAHGTQKLFGWFGGHGPRDTAGFFAQLGFRWATAMAILAGAAETAGVLFALGFLTPFAALGMAIVMLVSIVTVHLEKGFWATNGGYEFNLALLTVAIAVAATGPGRFSIDRALAWDDNLRGLWWGVGVAAATAAIGFVVLTLGRRSQALKPHPA